MFGCAVCRWLSDGWPYENLNNDTHTLRCRIASHGHDAVTSKVIKNAVKFLSNHLKGRVFSKMVGVEAMVM